MGSIYRKLRARRRKLLQVAKVILFLIFGSLGLYENNLVIGILGIIAALIVFMNIRKERSKVKSQIPSKSSEAWENDLGVFSYTDDGVTVDFGKEMRTIKWADINTIFAYKKDYMTIDAIWMDIFYQDISLSISEDLYGWRQFQYKLLSVFPEIRKNWEIEIAFPAFKQNFTLLFDTKERTLEQAIEFYYKK